MELKNVKQTPYLEKYRVFADKSAGYVNRESIGIKQNSNFCRRQIDLSKIQCNLMALIYWIPSLDYCFSVAKEFEYIDNADSYPG